MFKKCLSYKDVLLVPKLSIVESRSNVTLKSNLTKNIQLNFPIIAANMDTVCEDDMAIALAKFGGIGILHRYLSIQDQVNMVKKVKRHINYIIESPYTLPPTATIKQAKEHIKQNKVGTFLVVDKQNKLLGIATKRDLLFSPSDQTQIQTIMTPKKNIITAPLNITPEEAFNILKKHKYEQIPIITKDNTLHGMITLKDIIYHKRYNNTFSLDKKKRLMVGAAIGVNGDYLVRAHALIQAEVDVLVIDIAHGHSILAANALKKLKTIHPNIPIIAGNVCTKEGVRYLAAAGADAIKVNVGAGSICTTRKVTGFGVPQLSSVISCCLEAKKHNIPIISDGGNGGEIGSICKAFAAGASTVMLGRRLAGCVESPGPVLNKDGKKVKLVRGMAGYGSNMAKNNKLGKSNTNITNMTPEGVEGYVAFSGNAKGVLNQIKKGLQSACSYGGVNKLEDLHKNAEFIEITNSGFIESGHHGIAKL